MTSTTVFVAILIIGQTLRFFFFETSPETRKHVLSVITNQSSSIVYDTSFNLLSLALLTSLILGLFKHSLTFMFDPVDLRILRPTPVKSSEMYLAKHVRDVVKYTPIIILSVLVALPIMDYLRLTFVEKMLMLSIIPVFFGLLKVLKNFTFFLTQTLIAILRAKRMAVASTLIVSLIIVFALMGGVFHRMVIKALPSTLVTEIILASVAIKRTLESLLTPYTALIAGYIGLLAFTLVASEWYDKIAKYDEQRQPILLRLLRGRSFWNLRFWHDPTLTIALKDFWVNLREDFPVNVVYPCCILGIMMLLQFGLTEEFALLPFAFDVPFISFSAIIAVFPFTALSSLDSFTREPGHIWILKTSPIPPTKIIYGKYLYALFTSAFTVAPLLVYAVILFLTPIQWAMIWTIPHTLLISNAIGIYIGARQPLTSRGQVSFAQILSSVVLTTALTAVVPIGILFFPDKRPQAIVAFEIVTSYTVLVSYKFLKLASNALKWNEKLL